MIAQLAGLPATLRVNWSTMLPRLRTRISQEACEPGSTASVLGEIDRATPPGSGYDRPGGGPNVNFNLSALPVTPGNAELLVYILATILIAIIALASDAVNSGAFVTAFTALTFAYLISRGIAKASRVLEQ